VRVKRQVAPEPF